MSGIIHKKQQNVEQVKPRFRPPVPLKKYNLCLPNFAGYPRLIRLILISQVDEMGALFTEPDITPIKWIHS